MKVAKLSRPHLELHHEYFLQQNPSERLNESDGETLRNAAIEMRQDRFRSRDGFKVKAEVF